MFINSYNKFNNITFGTSQQANYKGVSKKISNSDSFSLNNPSGKEIRIKDICANDLHGHLKAFRQFKTAVDRFRMQNPDASVFISGDSWVGAYEKKNEVIMRIQNLIKPDGYTLGNHEFDNKGTKGVSKALDLATFKTLALNIKPKNGIKPENYSLQDDVDSGRLVSSSIVEKNGVKRGYIGLVPFDFAARVSQQTKDCLSDVHIMNMEETKKALQAEVDKLEKQGVNIITLVSHAGLDADKEIAKSVVGIDIIHGAHSHDSLDGIHPGENYFISKRNEPVLITQAGKNGHQYAVSDVVFKDGKIVAAKNELHQLDNLPESLSVKTMEKIFLGNSKTIGYIAHDVKSKPETVLEESPLSSFLSDAYKKYTGADIILNNMGGIRASLPAGPVTEGNIMDIMPFFNEVYIYRLSEKDVVDTLNNAVQALRKYNRTGAVQVSGLRYVIGKDDKIKEAYLVKDDGSKQPLNVQNPSKDKFFNVAYNSFVAGGTEGLELLKATDKFVKKCDMNETEMFIEYIKSFNNKPISIKEDGRIQKID